MLYKTVNYFFAMGILLTTWLSAAQNNPPDIQYADQITEGLAAPVRLAIDSKDNVFVTDAFYRSVNKYDSNGNLVRSYETGGNPISIAVNNKDQVFVGDGDSGIIYHLLEDGSKNILYSEASFPSSMAFGPDNKLYIADSKKNEIIVLDHSGSLIQTIGNGLVSYPTGIAYDYKNDRLVVAEHGAVEDSTEVTMYIFDLDGNLVTSFGSEASSSWFSGVKVPGNGQFSRIQGLSVSRCGSIYVLDPFQATVSVFDEETVFKTKFGQLGKEPGELNIPLDIAMNSEDQIVISSMNNGSLEVFSYTDVVPTANIKMKDSTICSNQSIGIPIHLTGKPGWKFTYSIDGVEQDTIQTTETPYLLNTNLPGIYEVTFLSDSITTGTCFSGSPKITVSDQGYTAALSGINTTVCQGEMASMEVNLSGTPPFTFSYTLDGKDEQTITTSETSYEIQVEQAGMYQLSKLNPGNCAGSSLSGDVLVVVNNKPTAKVPENSKYNRIDPGSSIEIPVAFTGSAPFIFTYASNGTAARAITTSNNPYMLEVSEEGTYEITFIEDAYCNNSEWQDFFDVNYNAIQPPTSAILALDQEICPGEIAEISIELTGAAPWTFTYTVDGLNHTEVTTSDSFYSIYTSEPGLYQVSSLEDKNTKGLEMTGSCLISELPAPTAGFYHDSNELQVQFISSFTEEALHYWNFGDDATSLDANPTHIYSKKGEYEVTHRVETVCGAVELSQVIEVVKETIIEDVLIVYPNPSYGEFTVKINPQSPVTDNISIVVKDLNGRIVFSRLYDPADYSHFDGSIYLDVLMQDYQKGIHVLQLSAGSLEAQEKLILRK